MADTEQVTTPDFAVVPERALATVEPISSLRDIPNADNIVCARIRGWDVVVKRGEFEVGDLCVYFEVDSLLPTADPRFAFLADRGEKTDPEGRTGHVLKTAKFRGQYSQGLAFAVTDFPEVGVPQAGTDVTEALGVVKWEPPIPAEILAYAKGMRPSTIPATGEERAQNSEDIFTVPGVIWVATEKADGESTTIYVHPDEDTVGVCTRKVDLLRSPNSVQWRLAEQNRVHEQIMQTWPGRRVAVQGESVGPGFAKNPLRLKDPKFVAFTLRVDGVEVPRAEWPEWLLALSVPVYDMPFPASLEDALARVETLKSLIAPDRPAEGVVWRAVDRTSVLLSSGRIARASFKVISNRYLMKHDR